MSAADLHRARRVIARADATIEQRLTDIKAHAAELSVRITPLVIAAIDVLQLAREQAEQGVDIVPPDHALQLFDLANAFMHSADLMWERADLALIDARQRLARQDANGRRAA
jgi:hypothetical protein